MLAKSAILFLSVLGLSQATPITEVSTIGGTYSLGTGTSKVSFTINPWSVVTDNPDTFLQNIGAVTMPLICPTEIPDPVLVGQITVGAWGFETPLDLYVQTWQSRPGVFGFSLQMTGISDQNQSDPKTVGFWYPSPTFGAPGSVQTLGLQITAREAVPEPSQVMLTFIGLSLLAWRLRSRTA